MRKLLLPLLCMLFSGLSAQDLKIKFGEISPEIVKQKSYPKDSTVAAEVLYDYGEVSFDYRNQTIYIRLQYHGRIKIYSKAALDDANIEINAMEYASGVNYEELISGIKGFTYNIDEKGQLVKEKLTKEMIHTEKASDKVKSYKFTLPNVKEGSVIEYSYIKETPFGVSHNPGTWMFQTDKPTAWSEYKIRIPDYFYYRMLMGGYLGLYKNQYENVNISLGSENVSGREYRFVVKDAPAFMNEAYITTAMDYISKVDFELALIQIPGQPDKDYSLDYSSMAKTLMDNESFGQIINNTKFMRDAAKNIMAQTADSTERLHKAVAHIQEKIKHNGNYSIYANNLKKIIEKGEGDVADVNLALLCLLKEMGFAVNPVILSTRSNGRIHEQYAILKRFNCVVVQVEMGGKKMLLDATEKFLPVGALPPNYLNTNAVLITPTGYEMQKITPTLRDVELEKIDLTLDDEGLLTGTFEKSQGGYSGWSAKEHFKKTGEETYLKEVKEAKTGWKINKASYENTSTINESMLSKYEVEINDQATVAGDMIYLKPMITEGFTQNPFKSADRKYPMDFGYLTDEIFMGTYTIPEGYTVVEQPTPMNLALSDNGGRFTYIIKSEGNKISINSRLNIKKPFFGAEDYVMMKAFYDSIVQKHAEQIVLKKVK